MLAGLRDDLVGKVLASVPDARFNGDPGTDLIDGGPSRLPGNAHLSFPGCEGDSLLMLLDAHGIECSTGSACTSGVAQPSHVLLAMGADEATARGSLRFSLGHTSSSDDVDAVAAVIGAGRRAGAPGGAVAGGREGPMRVLAAMSGGVDSAVAAARAVDAGHDVVGVHLALSETPAALRGGSRGCCSREDAGDARRAADVLGHPVLRVGFRRAVRGRRRRRLRRCLRERADAQPVRAVQREDQVLRRCSIGRSAWASTRCAPGTTHGCAVLDPRTLRRAVDAGKDQSYVLAVLTAAQLRHAMFPIGDTPKTRIRAEAAARGLRVADKPDSHDICFIPSGDTRGFLAERLGARPGAVVDAGSGQVLARHDGVHGFTVGQRRGLGLGRPAADGRPRYVLGIEPASGTVRVGPAEALDVSVIDARRPVWSAGAAPDGPFTCTVQVRAHGGVAPATVHPDGAELHVELDTPLRGVAPGQVLALYRPDTAGDVVLGSATITAAH